MEDKSLDIVVAGYIVNQGELLLIHHKKLDKWLPPGGHINPNETPDEALRREINEELGLDINFCHYPIPRRGNRNEFAIPFYVDRHHITQDHLHYCFHYLCKPKSLEVNQSEVELKDYKWVAKEELESLTPALNEGDLVTCKEAIDLGKNF